MEGGVRLQDTPIERTGNMENLIDAEMAREDLGRMTFMSLEVRKKAVCMSNRGHYHVRRFVLKVKPECSSVLSSEATT